MTTLDKFHFPAKFVQIFEYIPNNGSFIGPKNILTQFFAQIFATFSQLSIHFCSFLFFLSFSILF